MGREGQWEPPRPHFSLWTNKFAFALGCVCFHLPNEKETFLYISLPQGNSPSTRFTHTETHSDAYKYDCREQSTITMVRNLVN